LTLNSFFKNHYEDFESLESVDEFRRTQKLVQISYCVFWVPGSSNTSSDTQVGFREEAVLKNAN
jgi:hypothetical protein